MFALRLLGDFALEHASGAPVEGLPRRGSALLMLLALSPEAGCSRERAAALLWPDTPVEWARQRLRQLLSDLRHLALPLQTDPARVALIADAIRIDVHAFEQLAASAEVDDRRKAAASWDSGTRVWGLSFMGCRTSHRRRRHVDAGLMPG